MRKRLSALLSLLLLVLGGFLLGRAQADQPHMQAALDHLKAAKAELEKADEDKGGHRVKAIRLVNDAIVQVEKGISFDRRH
jgi:outer membrane lipoprotein-sorting protein